MEFEYGQIIEGRDPNAVVWCNEHRAILVEVEPITRAEKQEILVKEVEYDENGEIVSEAVYETKEVEVTVQRYQITALPEPTVEEIQERIQKQLTDAVQHVLDAKAQELLYDNCLSVCSYIDTGVAKFDAEGKAFRAWRSAVWAKGYEILAQVQTGQRSIPTEEQLIAELPKLVINY